MTGLDKITSQIQEEAEASAKERLDAANKEKCLPDSEGRGYGKLFPDNGKISKDLCAGG